MNDPSPAFSSLFCFLFVFVTMLMIVFVSAIRVVPEFRRLSVYRLGRYIGEKGPGIVLLIPFVDKAITIDVRKQVKDVEAPQALVGATGDTLTSIHAGGSVEIAGERWSAISKMPIAAGAKVRVTKVILEIEEL